jgi:NAD(P)-dependent dehydrogenase (short-subunit alcohol dehydrogenase family)
MSGAHTLADRHVVVMGAGGGLGPTVVAAAAAAGARLTLVGHGPDSLQPLQQTHPDHVQRIAAVDLTDPDAVDALAADLRDSGVDVVWHLVGGWRGGAPLPEAPREDWDWLTARLVTSTVNVTRAFAGPLATSAYGRFALVSSPQAVAPTTTNAAYAATKAAAEATTLALADHFRSVDSPATANIVVVPAILTDAMRAAQPDRSWTTQVPAEDIADTLVFLAGDAAAKMNGQRIRLYAGSPS